MKIILTRPRRCRNVPAVKWVGALLKGSGMKRFLTVLACLVMIGALLFSAGCGTWKGVGKDVEGLGEAIQD